MNLPEEILATLRTEEQLQALATGGFYEEVPEVPDVEATVEEPSEEHEAVIADLVWVQEGTGIQDEEGEEPDDAVNESQESLMDISNMGPLARPDLCKGCGMPAQPHESKLCQQCKAVVHWHCGFPTRGRVDLDDLLCNLCHNQAEIDRNRQDAHVGQQAAAVKMKERSDGILDVLKVGDSVLVPVPDVDRGPADPANIMGVVLEEKNSVYLVGTAAGVLKVNRDLHTP